jgi:uncharacterized protein (TIGR03437 family)
MKFFATLVGTVLTWTWLGFAAVPALEPSPLEQRIAALNQELLRTGGPAPKGAAHTAQSDATRVAGVIAERSAALRELIRRNPAQALSLALAEPALGNLKRAYPDLASELEERGEWSGPVIEMYADDFENHTSTRLLKMRTAVGSLDLRFAYGEPVELRTGQQATVQGLRIATTVAAVWATVTVPAPSAGACSTTGEQKVLALLVTAPGQQSPVSQAKAREMLFGTAGRSLDGYWKDASYGKTWVTGDVIANLTLDRAYACGDNGEEDQMLDAALLAAGQQVDVSQYNRFLIFFPTLNLTQCGYLGLGYVGCFGGLSAAWFPVGQVDLDEGRNLPVIAHEGGHNLGLNEVTGRRYSFPLEPLGAPDNAGVRTTYYDPFTEMGNFPGVFGHYNARQKRQIGWLNADEVVTVEQPGTYQIAPLGTGAGTPKALRIRRGDLNSWLWAEYRKSEGLYESSLPNQVYAGALIHYEDSVNQDVGFRNGSTDLLDFTPGSNETSSRNDFLDPALAVGQSWSDPWIPESIAVTTADAGGLSIQVSQDTCVSLLASSALHGSGENSGTVGVLAPSDCQWSVRISQPWVTVPAATSGMGNTTLGYHLEPNGTGRTRQAFISIGRRPFQITQSGSNDLPSAVAVFPDSGAGYAQTFTFIFSDPNGAADIILATADFRESASGRRCTVYVSPSSRTAGLQDENSSNGAGPWGSPTVLENNHCSLNLSGVSVSQSGSQIYVRMPITFKSEFDGPKDVLLSATDTSTSSSTPVTLGQWTVGPIQGPAPVITSAGVVNAASYQGGAVAPGEIVAIFGENLGPAGIAYASYNPVGNLGNFAGGTKVFFDGVQAPMLYALAGQVSAIVPYSVSGSTKIVVEYQGRKSNEVPLPVAAAVPGIFRYPSSAQGVIVHEAGFNTELLPVARGKIVWFYVTGEGQTVPAGVDGKLPVAPNWPVPAGEVTVLFGGVPGRVDWRGLVYGGVLQLNVWVPENAPVGNSVPLAVSVGGISSATGTTIAIK